MGTTLTTGNGPFEFTDSNGRQVSIPLSVLQFTNGTLGVDATKWTPFKNSYPADEQALINNLLAYFASQQLIVPAVVPSPKPAMVVKAADPGTAGNNIAVTIENIVPDRDPTKVKFNLKVTETDTYTGLSASNIESVLGGVTATGTIAVPGTQPGLVQILDGSVVAGGIPAAKDYPLTGGGATPASVNVVDGGNRVFTLQAKKGGAGGNQTTVTISNVAGNLFNLNAVWTNKMSGVTIGTLQQIVASNFGYEITVATPSGGAFSVPAAVTTALSGGANGAFASATLFAAQ